MCREHDIYYSRESDMWPVDFVRFFVFGVNSKLPLEAQFLTPDLAQRKDSPFRSNHYTFCAWGRQTQTVDAAISIFLCKSGLLMTKVWTQFSVAQTGNIPLKETHKRIRERSQIEKDKVTKATRLRVRLTWTAECGRSLNFSEERLGK